MAASSSRADPQDRSCPSIRDSCSRKCPPKTCRLDYMQRRRFLVIVFCAVLIACGSRSTERTYAVHGQVIALTPDRREATIKHGEIKGLMPAMTMPYKIKEKAELDAIKPGDLIAATLVIVANDAYL